MIKVSNLKKSFDDQVVINGIDLEVQENQIISIIGESGSGKSVFLKLIMGFIKPDSGQIIINGHVINSLEEKKMLNVRKDIGYLFQESALFDFMTVYENLAFPLKENTNLSSEKINKKIKVTLERVELKNVEDKLPHQLSGGMKKRVGIARAIIMEPKILLCDEPTTSLDPQKSFLIMQLIAKIARSLKAACIIASHDVSNVFRFSDIIAFLYEGKLIIKGDKNQLLKTNLKEVKDFLMLAEDEAGLKRG